MAERLLKYDWTQSSNITTTERRSYPWDEWFDGHIWRISWGEDFDTHPLMMERVIRTRATSRKIKLSLRHEPRAVVAAGPHVFSDPFGHIVFQAKSVTPKNTWKLVPKVEPTPEEQQEANQQFAMANPVAHTPVRSKRPVRPKGAA